LSALGLWFAATNGIAQPAGAAPDGIEKELGRVIRERLDAYARRDAAGWARLVADDCLCGTETKAEIQQGIAARPANLKSWYGEISDLQVRTYGDTAVARYKITETTELAGQRLTALQRRLETYVRRDGRWLLVGGIDSVIPPDPAVAKIDPKVYEAYVGRYEYAPGMVDTVTRQGDRLLVQVTGQAPEELFPETETIFFGKSQDWRLIFVRDGQGRVTSVRFRQNGQELVGKRVE
jgi:ketosteroid isomerase-like protein